MFTFNSNKMPVALIGAVLCVIALDIAASYGVKNRQIAQSLWLIFNPQIPKEFFDRKRSPFLTANLTLPHAGHEFSVLLSTSKMGIRDRNYTPAELADTDKICLIGDSFGFGWGVKDSLTLAKQLESKLGGPAVVNAGLPGAMLSKNYMEVLQTLKKEMEFSTVIVEIFIGNDMEQIPQPAGRGPENVGVVSTTDQKRKSPSGYISALLTRSRLVQRVLTLIKRNEKALQFGLLIKGRFKRGIFGSKNWIFSNNYTPVEQAAFGSYLGHLGKIKKWCDSNDSKMFVVIIPKRLQVEQYDRIGKVLGEIGKPGRLITEYCTSMNIPAVDLLPSLREEFLANGRYLYFRHDGHLNSLGIRVAAEAITKELNAML